MDQWGLDPYALLIAPFHPARYAFCQVIFFAAAHYFDFQKMSRRGRAHIDRFSHDRLRCQTQATVAIERDVLEGDADGPLVSLRLEQLIQQAWEARMDDMSKDAAAVQARLNTTCDAIAYASLHLLFVHTAQLQVVVMNFAAHMSGSLSDIEYWPDHWYWLLADIFHGGVGTLLLATYLITGLAVTRASQKAIEDIDEHAKKRGVRAAHRAALLAQLSFTVEGYEMCGITITPEMAVQFLWAQMLVLWGSFSSAFVRV